MQGVSKGAAKHTHGASPAPSLTSAKSFWKFRSLRRWEFFLEAQGGRGGGRLHEGGGDGSPWERQHAGGEKATAAVSPDLFLDPLLFDGLLLLFRLLLHCVPQRPSAKGAKAFLGPQGGVAIKLGEGIALESSFTQGEEAPPPPSLPCVLHPTS